MDSPAAILRAITQRTTDTRAAILGYVATCPGAIADAEQALAFIGGEARRFRTYLADLRSQGCLDKDSLAALVLMPVVHWRGQQARRILPIFTQDMLTPANDLVRARAGAAAALAPAPAPVPAPLPEIDRVGIEVEIDPRTREKEISSSRVPDRSRGQMGPMGGMGDMGTRAYLLNKLRRMPRLEQEIFKPQTDDQKRMSRIFWEFEATDPQWLERTVALAAELPPFRGGVATNRAAWLNKAMTNRLALNRPNLNPK